MMAFFPMYTYDPIEAADTTAPSPMYTCSPITSGKNAILRQEKLENKWHEFKNVEMENLENRLIRIKFDKNRNKQNSTSKIRICRSGKIYNNQIYLCN